MKVRSEISVDDLWREYKIESRLEAREKLILHYAPIVKYVAGRICANLPQNVDQGDIVSYGIFGLIDAVEKYDVEREVKFETYAISRIKGAIIDELRCLDWVPRSIRTRAKEIERAYVDLENRLKRIPTDEEVADALGISTDEYRDILAQVSSTSMLALDELWSSSDRDDRISLIDTIEDTSSPEPSLAFEFEEMKELLGQALNRLTEREKTVIALYYYDGLTLKEIGEILGVTESRVSQLHTKAVLRLRGKLNNPPASPGDEES
ncbi:MAG: RNA polymerase sigma factor WhiG [Actinobacteria bacterium]|nr:RNA polymerase sigma factor WhiG [Actinomycetota bacterium]